jgi:hypothetical protein
MQDLNLTFETFKIATYAKYAELYKNWTKSQDPMRVRLCQ